MNLSNLRYVVRDLTKTTLSTDDTTALSLSGGISGGDPNFPDTLVNLYLSNAAHLMAEEIVQSQDDWDFQEDWATTDLVANQREYKLPTTASSGIIKIKRVEISFDGVNWVRANFKDEGQLKVPISDEASITRQFNNHQPLVNMVENSLYILSGTITAVTAGLKIWYTKETVGKSAAGVDLISFATTTDVPNVAAAFQEGLCYKTAKKFFQGFGDLNKAEIMDEQFEKILIRAKSFYAGRIEPRGLKAEPVSRLENYE